MSTAATYLELLQQQLQKIDTRDFDLVSWKKATILLVTSCFGSNSPQVAALEKIDYAYSSWALRDESGTSDPVKTDCKTTLSTIIDELKIKSENSTDEKPASKANNLNFMWLPFEDELTGASLKKLKALLTKANVTDEEVQMFLKDLPSQTLVDIIKHMLLSKEFKQWITQ
ncbi:hypothetical protein [Carboxylicivirga taeanensis]|uniref:hypothetical protein n=1 Tax=Carboxylicivirga taeanensis TaxID=1416875 RepID=UPI003F6DD53B